MYIYDMWLKIGITVYQVQYNAIFIVEEKLGTYVLTAVDHRKYILTTM